MNLLCPWLAALAAFTVPGQGQAVWNMIEADLKESGVECPQDQLLAKIGPTLVGTVITNDAKLKAQCIDAT
ncbi:MAG TPA: hypothetical protein VMP01_29745, partial [Pirellulaceae bacterium]|nr:hypothetical protein [Pirellulaceae bacterium]